MSDDPGDMAEGVVAGKPAGALRRVLVPLALAQFICSFAGSNMNVMINDISEDRTPRFRAFRRPSRSSCW